MNPFKTVCDGTVIDVFLDDPVWVRQAGPIRVRCDSDQAQGLVSSDSNTTYQLIDRPSMDGADQMQKVSVISVPAAEATALLEALGSGPVPEPEPTPEPEDNALEVVRENTITKMSAACNAAITAGVDVTLSDGQTYHFSLALEDQLNLLSLQGMLTAGAEAVPYHADGEECRYYSAEDFSAIAQAATMWKLYQESYYNSLRSYIRDMETMAELLAVTYGMEIPEAYQTDVLKGLLAQMGGG